MEEFNANKLLFLKSSLFASFLKIVQECPEKEFVKVIAYESTIIKTFSEFYQDVVKLQLYLIKQPESTVVTKNFNTYTHLVQIVAVILSGKTLCILSPLDSEAELTHKLSSLNSKFLLLDNKLSDKLIIHTTLEKNLEKIDAAPIMIQVFTSGTTGYNKIVCLSEKNIIVNIEALIRHHKLQKNDVICTALPVFHVNTLGFSFLTSLINGNKLILFNFFNIFDFFRELKESKVTIASVVPHIIFQFINGQKFLKKDALQNLKYFVSAASYLSVNLLTQFNNLFKIKIIQGYGLSEAVNFSTTMPIDLSDSDYDVCNVNKEETSIGVELFGNNIAIINKNKQEVKELEIGEICIRGWNVMQGYLNKNGSFLIGDDYLETGDLGYFRIFNKQKYFYIVGRKKDILKINGETVSLKQTDEILQLFCGKQIDAISFGFQNNYKIENLGVVLKYEGNILVQNLTEEVKLFFKKYNKNLMPQVVLFTKQKVRTSSGKPLRWIYRKYIENSKIEILKNELTIQEVVNFND